MSDFFLRPVECSDLLPIAELYMEIYLQTNSIEKWTINSSTNYVTYFYDQCKELFFVAKCKEVLVGGVWGQVKPWWSGNKIYNLEVFVKGVHQRQGLSKLLLRRFFEEAYARFRAVTVEAVTFNDRSFPLDYYERIELKKDKQLVLLEGNISDILKNL